MSLHFRKSFKIAPCVRLNFNKKSAGITLGGKGFHYTVNSRGKRTATAGIPGTGLYYTQSSGGSNSKTRQSTPKSNRQSSTSVTTNYANYLSQMNNSTQTLNNNKILYLTVILSLIVFPPGGIIYMYYCKIPSEIDRRKKFAISSCVWFIFLCTIIVAIRINQSADVSQNASSVVTEEITSSSLNSTTNESIDILPELNVNTEPNNTVFFEYDELQQLYLDLNTNLNYSEMLELIQSTGLPYSEVKYNGSRVVQVAFTDGATAQKYKKRTWLLLKNLLLLSKKRK